MEVNGMSKTPSQDQTKEFNSDRQSVKREGSVAGSKKAASVAGSARSRARNQELKDVWPNPQKYNQRSLFLFTLENRFRRALIFAIEWPWWDRTVLGMILLNSCTLAYHQPYDIPELRPDGREREAFELTSQVFSAFFTLECLVKVLALGFIGGRGTYLSDSWNYLDFFIVIIGVLDFFPSGGATGNLSALRSLRVMRPLRAITKFPQLKFLVTLLLKCVPMLANVVGLLTFIFFIFGILGVQLFGGQLRGGCYDIDSGTFSPTDDGGPCSILKTGLNICKLNQECLLLSMNPDNGMTSFDSILLAFMSIFQIMTYSGWTDVLYAVQNAYSRYIFAYFMFLILIGPIFAVQLFLVVIAKMYAEEKARMAQVAQSQLAQAQMQSAQGTAVGALLTSGQANPAQQELLTNGGEFDEIPPQHKPNLYNSEDGLVVNGKSFGNSGFQEQSAEKDVQTSSKLKSRPSEVMSLAPQVSVAPDMDDFSVSRSLEGNRFVCWPLMAMHAKLFEIAESKRLEYFILAIIVVNTVIMGMDVNCDFCMDGFCSKYKGSLEVTNVFFNTVFAGELFIKLAAYGPRGYFVVPMNWLDVAIVVVGMVEMNSIIETSSCLLVSKSCIAYDECEGGGAISALRTFRLVRIVKLLRAFPDIQKQVTAIVNTLESVAALIGLILLFLLIFCILGMNVMGGYLLENWGINLERGSEVFVQIPGDFMERTPFPVQGRRGIIRDFVDNRTSAPWRVCIWYGKELFGMLDPYIDDQGCTWADSIDTAGLNTPAIVAVMERDHYDDLGHAFISTFGVLTGSNWNAQAYNITYRLNKTIFLYYMAWMVLGNWMLLNLFVAILIQGFAEQKQKNRDSTKTLLAKRIMETLGSSSEEDLSQRMFDLFQQVDKDGSGLIDRDEMDMMLKELNVPMEPKDLKALFSKYDEDGSGQITFNRFFIMIKDLLDFARGELNQEAGAEKGEILKMSNREMLKAMGEAEKKAQEKERQKEEEQRKIAMQKARFAQELVAKLGNSSEQDLSQRMFSLFQEVDDDNSGMIDVKELQKLFDKCEVSMDPKDLAELFAKYDNDGSGEISFREFFMMIKELIAMANDVLNSDTSHALSDASTVKVRSPSQQMDSITNEMDAAYDDAEQLALQAEKKRRLARMQAEATRINLIDAAGADGGPAEQLVESMPRSLGVLRTNNPLRRAAKAFLDYPPGRTENKWFDSLVLLGILSSSALLAMDNPDIGTDSPQRRTMEDFGLALNALFLLECICKVAVLSFRSYWASGWNKLDFLIVSSSVLDMSLTYGLKGQTVDLAALKIFRMLRILRALRPLRIIARAKGLKLLVTTLLSAAKPIANTVAIALAVFSIYGILGMQFLLGRLYSCSDTSIFRKDDCHGVDADGNDLLWTSYPVNFDNLFRAVVALFILATQDDWLKHMWAGIDSTGKLTGPIQNNNPLYAIFYLGAILLAGYLVINIFVGVFVDSYNVAADKMSKESDSKAEPPAKMPLLDCDDGDGVRQEIAEVVSNSNFDLFVAFFIVTNVITMAFESYQQASWQTRFSLVSNFFYSLVFGWECAFKVFAFHPAAYYRAGWNRFDFFIVMVTFGGVAIDALGNAVQLDPTILRVLRVFRVFRILRAFRIFKAAKGLQAIVTTLFRSLPALANLFAMLGLFFFIFAILGVTLFGPLCDLNDPYQPGLAAVRCSLVPIENRLNPKACFRDIASAFATLFRCATGDGWGNLLYACSIVPPVRAAIAPSLWDSFHRLNGSARNPAAEASVAALDFAKLALRGWNASVALPGGGYPSPATTPGWPLPSGEAAAWMNLAQSALPMCMTDEEAVALELEGLMDCSVGGYSRACVATCGDSVIPTLYFFVFSVVATFILLQLVIAVLMEQLGGAAEAAERDRRTPGCSRLRRFVFERMCRRWRHRALKKLSAIAAKRHAANKAAAAASKAAAAAAKEDGDGGGGGGTLAGGSGRSDVLLATPSSRGSQRGLFSRS